MSVTWNHEIRDGNMIYREGCCLSTDTKPTSDPTLGNGSKLLEMDTSEMWIYDADGCEWFGPDGALNDTIRFIRPKLIYNDEYVGIDFRLKLPAGKTPSDYPGSYVKLAGSFNNNVTWNMSGSAVNANTQWPLTDVDEAGVCHIKIALSPLASAWVFTPTLYYTDSGVSTTLSGNGFSFENVIGFDIKRESGHYAKELKAYVDFCYYWLMYYHTYGQGSYPKIALRYSVYDKTANELIRLYDEYSDHFYSLQDDDMPTVGASAAFNVKTRMNIGVICANGYTIQSGSVDDVPTTVSTSGGRKVLTAPYFSIRNGITHIYTFKMNDVVRLKSSLLGYFYTMINLPNNANLTELHNFAYAVLQYAKITHQI